MASIKMTALLLLAAAGAKAQSFSFDDLFGQAGKQKQYYIQQIAAYRVFKSELKQGYQVIKNGLGGIRDINTAELNLHSNYYHSLAQVNVAVKNNSQVQDILQWQSEIESSFNPPIKGLTNDEQSYFTHVKAGIFKACNNDLTDLQNLLQSGSLQMTDDERLTRLAQIHIAMRDKYRFTRHFTGSVRLLAAQRQQSMNDTQSLKNLYGNH